MACDWLKDRSDDADILLTVVYELDTLKHETKSFARPWYGLFSIRLLECSLSICVCLY